MHMHMHMHTHKHTYTHAHTHHSERERERDASGTGPIDIAGGVACTVFSYALPSHFALSSLPPSLRPSLPPTRRTANRLLPLSWKSHSTHTCENSASPSRQCAGVVPKSIFSLPREVFATLPWRGVPFFSRKHDSRYPIGLRPTTGCRSHTSPPPSILAFMCTGAGVSPVICAAARSLGRAWLPTNPYLRV